MVQFKNKKGFIVTKFIFDGKISSFFKIWLLNIILNILTIGIYSFWGKVRLLKYMATSFILLGDRFEYIGTGKQLLTGFLKVALVV